MKITLPTSIVFITGTFVAHNCWDEWKAYFESAGYACLAPAWPYKNSSPEALRNRHPDADIALNDLVGITGYFASIIRGLPEKPILIGHSIGGLIVQSLIERGIAAAGVAVHSFPPHGVNTLRFIFMKAIWKSMGFFTPIGKSYMISFMCWRLLIANRMTWNEQKELFYRYAIPESKLIMRDLFKFRTTIDFKSSRVPLLFISGSNDLIAPAWMNFKNFKQYRRGNSIAEYKEFYGHNHLVFDQPASSEAAGFTHTWIERLK